MDVSSEIGEDSLDVVGGESLGAWGEEAGDEDGSDDK